MVFESNLKSVLDKDVPPGVCFFHVVHKKQHVPFFAPRRLSLGVTVPHRAPEKWPLPLDGLSKGCQQRVVDDLITLEALDCCICKPWSNNSWITNWTKNTLTAEIFGHQTSVKKNVLKHILSDLVQTPGGQDVPHLGRATSELPFAKVELCEGRSSQDPVTCHHLCCGDGEV